MHFQWEGPNKACSIQRGLWSGPLVAFNNSMMHLGGRYTGDILAKHLKAHLFETAFMTTA